MSGFILHCLHNSWQSEDSLADLQRKRNARRVWPSRPEKSS
jgi:hypothetical protein